MIIKELTNILDVDEKDFVIKGLQKETNQKMLLLFNKLQEDLQNEVETAKEGLYKMLYDAPYHSKSDYKIRNDIRLLCRYIEERVVEYQRPKNEDLQRKSGDWILLKVLQQRGALSLFEKYWNKFFRKAEKQRAFGELFELQQLSIDFQQKKSEASYEHFANLKESIHRALDFKMLKVAEEVKRLELLLSKTERSMQAYRDNPNFAFSPSIQNINLQKLTSKELILEYYELFALQYQQFGAKKLKTLIQLAELHPKIIAYRPDLKPQIITIRATIGIEYFLVCEYEKAHQQYLQALELNKKYKQPTNLALQFNYVSNLVKMGKYEKVIEVILKLQNVIKKNPVFRYLFDFQLIVCYLILKENDKAYQRLHVNTHHRPESQYYNFQFAYAIYYYQTKQEELCENCIQNIYQHIRRNNPLEKSFELIVNLYRRFFNLVYHTIDSQKLQTQLQSIYEDIFNANEIDTFVSDNYLMLWLREEIERLK